MARSSRHTLPPTTTRALEHEPTLAHIPQPPGAATIEQTGSSSMASPIRSPPTEPEPAAEAQPPPPSPPPSQLPAVDRSRPSPDNLTPAPPLTAAPTITAPPPDSARDSAPSSPPSPPKTPTDPPLSTTDPSPPPLPRGNQTSAPRRTPPPAPAPALAPPPPPPPAPASPEAKPEREGDESPGESEETTATLALALTQTEQVLPPAPQKEAVVAESPTGSPQKESALTIAKLLSGEDPAATDAKPAAEKVAPAVTSKPDAGGGGGGGGRVGAGSKRWLLSGVPDKVRRTELKKAELGFRISAAVFCLISLSVMSAGTTPGWSGDSFRRYNEYRYTLSASVMAFTYSGFQLVAEVHYLVTGRRIIGDPWGNYFNLAMDQVLAYLLLSASSAALSRNDVWVSRFGVDQFAKLINASGSMAFLAFIALGLSSIISAYRVFSSMS